MAVSDAHVDAGDAVRICPTCGSSYASIAVFCARDGVRLVAADEDSHDPYLGMRVLDQFEIEERIGSGGMGRVYRARQRHLGRDVALKILRSDLLANAEAVRRFQREAEVTTALDHPNVVRVFFLGELPDGIPYLLMEYLPGPSLADVLREERALPWKRALSLALSICDGIGEAHAHGIVHRDVKPENVIVMRRGTDGETCKVLDFGIARLLGARESLAATQAGVVFGTARYISPEGAAGEPTDARSDVYSIGVLLYQLLAGRPPFDGDSPVAILMKHLSDAPPDVRDVASAPIPDALGEVVMRALAKSPDARFADARAFGAALREACDVVPMPAPSGAEIEDASARDEAALPPLPMRRVDLRWVAAVFSFVLGAGAVITGALLFGEKTPSTSPAPSATPSASVELDAVAGPPRATSRLVLVPESPEVGQPVMLSATSALPLDRNVEFRVQAIDEPPGAAVAAVRGENPLRWIATHTFAKAGAHRVSFRGLDARGGLVELASEIVVKPRDASPRVAHRKRSPTTRPARANSGIDWPEAIRSEPTTEATSPVPIGPAERVPEARPDRSAPIELPPADQEVSNPFVPLPADRPLTPIPDLPKAPPPRPPTEHPPVAPPPSPWSGPNVL